MLALAGRGFDRALEILSMALVVALLADVSAGIFARAAGHPLGFTDELAGYLMVWLSCFGWMLATRRGAHIRIRYFLDRMPGMARLGTEWITELSAITVGAVIVWKSLHLIEVNHDVEALSMPLSTSWLYVPLVPAGLTTLCQGIADLLATLRGRHVL